MSATATTHTIYAVQLSDPRFPEAEGYCGCYAELVADADYDRVQAELVAANATTTRDERGRAIRTFWTDPEEAELAADRAEMEYPGVIAEVDPVRD